MHKYTNITVQAYKDLPVRIHKQTMILPFIGIYPSLSCVDL